MKRPCNLNPVKPELVSDALYDATIGVLDTRDTYQKKTSWIHLIDAVSRGYVTPLEAWDAVALGYVPEHLLIRESAYCHLLSW